MSKNIEIYTSVKIAWHRVDLIRKGWGREGKSYRIGIWNSNDRNWREGLKKRKMTIDGLTKTHIYTNKCRAAKHLCCYSMAWLPQQLWLQQWWEGWWWQCTSISWSSSVAFSPFGGQYCLTARDLQHLTPEKEHKRACQR